jgi:hypothetical protein
LHFECRVFMYTPCLSAQVLNCILCLTFIYYVMISQQVRHSIGRMPDCHQVWAPHIFYLDLRLGQCREYLQFHNFAWLLPTGS